MMCAVASHAGVPVTGHSGGWDVLALLGPTASGKTKAAMALSQRFRIELISMDSALVYQGMDIGTAKPSVQERQAVCHHLVDTLAPEESFSAADFANAAKPLILDIKSRGAIPVVVGGTFLYLKALVQGLDDMPRADPKTRDQIELQAKALGWPKMHEKLQAIDPVTAQRLAPNDAQRISRALEVWALTGQSISSFQSQYAKTKLQSHGLAPTQVPSDVKALCVSFEPQERAWLHANIERRFMQMLEQGFLEEAYALYKRPTLSPDLPSMRCVGYRQAWVFWQSIEQEFGPLPEVFPSAQDLQVWTKTGYYDEFIQTSVAATRQLAKRQLTWLRSMKERHVLACDAPDFELQVKDHLDRAIDVHEDYKHCRLKS